MLKALVLNTSVRVSAVCLLSITGGNILKHGSLTAWHEMKFTGCQSNGDNIV